MKLWKKRIVAPFVLFTFVITTTGCGLILYPERRTEKLSNVKHTKTVVYDCLWLIAGIIPGVVALIVDAVEGTWYMTEKELADQRGAGTTAVPATVEPGTALSVRVHGMTPQDAHVTLRLMDAEGRDLAPPVHADAKAGRQFDTMSIEVPRDASAGRATLGLFVGDQQQTSWNVVVE